MIVTTAGKIRDCDYWTTIEEIQGAIQKTLHDYKGELDVKLTKLNSRLKRLTIVKMQGPAATQLLKPTLLRSVLSIIG